MAESYESEASCDPAVNKLTHSTLVLLIDVCRRSALSAGDRCLRVECGTGYVPERLRIASQLWSARV
jgi:hypothetical protein